MPYRPHPFAAPAPDSGRREKPSEGSAGSAALEGSASNPRHESSVAVKRAQTVGEDQREMLQERDRSGSQLPLP